MATAGVTNLNVSAIPLLVKKDIRWKTRMLWTSIPPPLKKTAVSLRGLDETTSVFRVFYKTQDSKVGNIGLVSKKSAKQTLANYDKGQAVCAFVPTTLAIPKQQIASFGYWSVVIK